MIAPLLEEFLTDRLRTHEIAHSGRTLYTHLSGTHALLRDWGNPPDVCLAGLFHSIYGTAHFRKRAFPIDDRATIAGLIGACAEHLAYVFCVTARPAELLRQMNSLSPQFMDGHVGGTLRVSRHELCCLLEIEAANLVEQGGRIHPTLEKLRRAPISAAARDAVATWLSSHAISTAEQGRGFAFARSRSPSQPDQGRTGP